MNLVEEIIECFKKAPTDFNKIKKLFSEREFTKEELAKIALTCVDICFCEYQLANDPEYDC